MQLCANPLALISFPVGLFDLGDCGDKASSSGGLIKWETNEDVEESEVEQSFDEILREFSVLA
jgi:hypothetical protein